MGVPQILKSKYARADFIARHFEGLMTRWEKSRIPNYAKRKGKYQPVFIIGAPRTGSTILYQYITNNLDVLYINNFIDIFHRNFFFGFTLANKFIGWQPHGCFKSVLGNTRACGWRGPSECGNFWYRWMPKDRHFLHSGDISNKALNEIGNNLFSVINKFDKPLVIKNLNAGQRLRVISKIAPHAKFIFVKRNPTFVAQSIFRVKQKLKRNNGEWWSIKPKNFESLMSLPPHEQIVKQIFYLEKQIFLDKKLIPPTNFIELNYEDFTADVGFALDKVRCFIDDNVAMKADDFDFRDISVNETTTIPKGDFEKIEQEVAKLNWKTYE